jgi:hypothetical protein
MIKKGASIFTTLCLAAVSLPQGGELTVVSECSLYGKKKTTISLGS